MSQIEQNNALNQARDTALFSRQRTQPKNTTKTYAKPIRLWKVCPLILACIPWGCSSVYPANNFIQEWCDKMKWQDGYLVNEKKVCKWLQDEVFNMKKPATKKEQNKHKKALAQHSAEGLPVQSIVLNTDDIEWGRIRGMNEQELLALLEEDRVDLEVDSVLDPETRATLDGKFLKFDTIYNSYISALAEEYQFQVATEQNHYPNFRGAALKNLLNSRRAEEDSLSRIQFEDRGAGGLNSSYTEADFINIQKALLKSSSERVTVSNRSKPHISFLNPFLYSLKTFLIL
jgi:hypothetical protein